MWLIKKAKDGQHFFVWVNSENKEVQVTSETYVTDSGAERGIEDFVDDLLKNGIRAIKDFDYDYSQN
jgi:uncharacterized protein YegP (UPF0339 family)